MLTLFFHDAFHTRKGSSKVNKLSGDSEDLVFRKGELLHVYQKHEKVTFRTVLLLSFSHVNLCL